MKSAFFLGLFLLFFTGCSQENYKIIQCEQTDSGFRYISRNDKGDSQSRYETNKFLIKLDTTTGKSWLLLGNKWSVIEDWTPSIQK